MNPVSIGNTPAPAAVPASLREVMSRFATGVTVLGTGGERPHAMTANAFSSVSLDPPTVLVCVAHEAVMHGAISETRRFGISVMGAGQEDLARFFADKKRPLGKAQFEGVGWHPGPKTGSPLLSGALAWLECTTDAAYTSNDHTIFVGSVVGSSSGGDGDALLFFGGSFLRSVSPLR